MKRKILLGVIGCALAVMLGLFLFTAQEYREARLGYDELRDEVVRQKKEDAYLSIDFDKLKKINPDIVAWLYIPGTRISYPVLQGSKYEHLNFKGETSICGSIFLTDDESLGSRNPILYGHNMRDGSMFGTLKRFKDASYGRKHQKVQLYQESGCLEYDLFAVVETTKDGEEYQTKFEGEEEFEEYVRKVRGKRMYSMEDKGENIERIVSLSTCDGVQGKKWRFFIQANIGRFGQKR